jgi:hypothetical protein
MTNGALRYVQASLCFADGLGAWDRVEMDRQMGSEWPSQKRYPFAATLMETALA